METLTGVCLKTSMSHTESLRETGNPFLTKERILLYSKLQTDETRVCWLRYSVTEEIPRQQADDLSLVKEEL